MLPHHHLPTRTPGIVSRLMLGVGMVSYALMFLLCVLVRVAASLLASLHCIRSVPDPDDVRTAFGPRIADPDLWHFTLY